MVRGRIYCILFFFTLVYFFIYLKIKPKSLVISLIISLIAISPYLKRNYENFDKYFLLTKSFGYNLLKGNNPETKVEGYVQFTKSRVKKKFQNRN